jgi:hypothetical protein
MSLSASGRPIGVSYSIVEDPPGTMIVMPEVFATAKICGARSYWGVMFA